MCGAAGSVAQDQLGKSGYVSSSNLTISLDVMSFATFRIVVGCARQATRADAGEEYDEGGEVHRNLTWGSQPPQPTEG